MSDTFGVSDICFRFILDETLNIKIKKSKSQTQAAKKARGPAAEPLTEASPSSPVVAMALPSQITGAIMDELDEKAIKPLQKSLRDVISRLDDIMDSRDRLLEQVEAIKA